MTGIHSMIILKDGIITYGEKSL